VWGDPSGDNFALSQTSSIDPMTYYNINGTEGNADLPDRRSGRANRKQ